MAITKNAIYRKSGLGPVLGKKQRQTYKGMIAESGQDTADQWLSNKLGFKYDPSKSNMSAIDKARFSALRQDKPKLAQRYKQSVLGPQEPVDTTAEDEEHAARHKKFMETLFPNTADYDYSDSPSFQSQEAQLNKQLGRLMSFRGLQGSSAEGEIFSGAYNQLLGQESARQDAIRQQEANRALQAQMYDVDTRTAAGRDQFNQMMAIAQLYTSQNPMAHAFGASTSLADLFNQMGGVAGRRSATPVAPPNYKYPSSPFAGAGNTAGIIGSGAANRGYLPAFY